MTVKYFLKGGTRAVWDQYNLPANWRSYRGEGIIEGKRCGTTQNIGPAARRKRLLDRQCQVNAVVA